MSEESRVRQRYVDLIVRPEARTIARQRVAVVRAVRRRSSDAAFSKSRCQAADTGRRRGGPPFVTHSNALDADLYLRIAPNSS